LSTLQVPAPRTPVFYMDGENNPLFSRAWYQFFLSASERITTGAVSDETNNVSTIQLSLLASTAPPFEPSVLPGVLISDQMVAKNQGLSERLNEVEKIVAGIQSAMEQLKETRDALYELQKVVAGLQAGVTI